MHYFADYLFVGRDSTGDCLSLMDTYHKVYLYSGVPIAPEKHTEGPIEHIVSQGLTIDSDSQTVTIPQQKLEEIWEKINLLLNMKKVTLNDLLVSTIFHFGQLPSEAPSCGA